MPSLPPVPLDVPKPPEVTTQVQRQQAFLLSNQPGECSTEIPLLLLQPFPPPHLLCAPQVWFSLLRQRQIIQGMCSLTHLRLSAHLETFQPILTNGLQHAEALL